MVVIMETIESCWYDTSGHTPERILGKSLARDLICRSLDTGWLNGADRSMRGDQLIRQWRVVSLLSGRVGRSLDQLKAELGMTKRTIQRDIAVLEAAGFPVIPESRGGTVYWRLLDSTKESAELSFTLPELMALYFSRDLLKVLHGSPMQDALDSALQKIGARLPASGHDLLRRLKDQTAVSVTGWKDYSKSSETISALSRAIRRNLTIRIAHKPLRAPEARTRTVDPYRLWYTGGGLYLVGYDHAKSAVRTFAIERVSGVSTTNQRFSVKEDFDFEAFQRTAFPVHGGEPQLVRIRFSPDQAPYVMERHWHDSQKFHSQKDGSVIMELQVANLWEVKRWLIGWGADATIIIPSSLIKAIQAECEGILREYDEHGKHGEN
jgi:predicted DNA-binding transcriptional regulator YafY